MKSIDMSKRVWKIHQGVEEQVWRAIQVQIKWVMSIRITVQHSTTCATGFHHEQQALSFSDTRVYNKCQFIFLTNKQEFFLQKKKCPISKGLSSPRNTKSAIKKKK